MDAASFPKSHATLRNEARIAARLSYPVMTRHTHRSASPELGRRSGAHLGYCLMTNHVHAIAVPERGDSMSVLMRRVHGRYPAHMTGSAGSGLRDMDRWRKERKNWREYINRPLPEHHERTTGGSFSRERRPLKTSLTMHQQVSQFDLFEGTSSAKTHARQAEQPISNQSEQPIEQPIRATNPSRATNPEQPIENSARITIEPERETLLFRSAGHSSARRQDARGAWSPLKCNR